MAREKRNEQVTLFNSMKICKITKDEGEKKMRIFFLYTSPFGSSAPTL
jgi:hypothetical protein